eukprot:1138478-Pelagomonas_calceolata.AAC.1
MARLVENGNEEVCTKVDEHLTPTAAFNLNLAAGLSLQIYCLTLSFGRGTSWQDRHQHFCSGALHDWEFGNSNFT